MSVATVSMDDRMASREADLELLKAVLAGDGTAYRGLVEKYQGRVYSMVYGMLRNREDARDVTQEAFVELWRLAPRYDASRGSVRSWAATLAHRRAIDRVRSEQSSRDRVEREAHKRPIQSADVAEQVVANIDGTRVRKALDRLTEMQRQAVELAYFGGHSYREVALLLDVAEGTIKTRIRDGMIRLRDELGVAT